MTIFKNATLSAFVEKAVNVLQQFLKQRAVISAGYLKTGLLDLYKAVEDIGLEVGPDGLIEDREEVSSQNYIHHKEFCLCHRFCQTHRWILLHCHRSIYLISTTV